jgi:anti-sigma factor RsiW
VNFLDCRNTRRQFDSLLLGELERERKAELESHLQQCTPCRQQWQEFRQFISLVQGSLRTIPPPQAMAPVSLTTMPRPRNRVVRAVAMATAGVLLLVFAALPLQLTPMPGPLQASSGIPSRSVVTLPNSQSVSPVQTQGSWYVAFH